MAATTTTITPTLTKAGREAAFNASMSGIAVEITKISFGGGIYAPDGSETALSDQYAIVNIAGGTSVSSTQIRITAVWADADLTEDITEIGIWAGDVLFAVWSTEAGTSIASKTPGTDFVLFCDLVFDQVPADSITVSIDPESSAVLSALAAHETDANAHEQYQLIENMAQAVGPLVWCGTAGGTADALLLTLPDASTLTSYEAGQTFSFIAASNNDGAMTVDVEGLGEVAITKAGTSVMVADDIVAGALYEIVYDGTQFQVRSCLAAGRTYETYTYTATAGQTSFSLSYTADLLQVVIDGKTQPPAAFTANDGATVTLGTALTAGQVVQFIVWNVFQVADTYTKAKSDATFAPIVAPTFTSTIAVVGAATLSSTLAVAGASTLTGAVAAKSTLTVTGATTLSSTLAVTGASTFTGMVTLGGGATTSASVTETVPGPGTQSSGNLISPKLRMAGYTAAAETLIALQGYSYTTANFAPGITGTRSLGSVGSHGQVTASKSALAIMASASDGSAYQQLGRLDFYTAEDTTSSSSAGELRVYTTPTGAVLPTLAATFGSDSSLTVVGATTLSSTLAVSGAATLSSTLAVTGASTLTGAVAAKSTLTVTGATTLSSTLAVTGAATLTASLSVGTTLAVTGAATLSSTLAVTGAATLSSTLAVTGTSTFTGVATFNNSLIVGSGGLEVGAGTSTTSYVDFHSSGLSTDYDSRIIATGGSSTVGSGVLTIYSSTLSVTGATTLSSTLSVAGKITAGSLAVTGATTLSSTLTVTGNISSGGNIYATGVVYANAASTWLATDGNIYGSVWGGYISTWLTTNLTLRSNIYNDIATYGSTTGGVGTYGFFRNGTGSTVAAGTSVSGSSLLYGSTGGYSGAPSGTWRCMGYAISGDHTLFVRVA